MAYSHEERPDFAEAVDFARARGLATLMAMDFQQRAARLKALALYLAERKEQLYALSHHSGATRADSWIDIEGGNATLFSYAGIGSRELPSGNLVHEGPAIPLGKQGHFAGSHIPVPRAGVAVHINAFNFPIWGMLEKFAPTFLAGMPCIVKPATSTSYLTEAVVRLMNASGLLPEGSLQLVIGSTGDLLDRLQGQDVVTFTGSADTAAKLRVTPNLVRNSVPFTAEADSLNCAIGPDVAPDSEEFDLYIKGGPRNDHQGRPEMHRHPPRHRTGQTSTPLPRACASGWPRWLSVTRRWKVCAWAPWPPRPASRCGRARAQPAAELRPAVRRQRWLCAAWRGRGRGRVLCSDLAAGPRPACRRRCPRYRSVRPGQHADGL